MPIWLRNAEGKLSWVNQAYVKAVELPDSNAVLKSLIEVAAPDRIDTTKADPKVGLLGRTHTVFAGAMRALNIHEVALLEGKAGFAVANDMILGDGMWTAGYRASQFSNNDKGVAYVVSEDSPDPVITRLAYIDAPAAEVRVDGTTVAETKRTTLVRIVLPVDRSKQAARQLPKFDKP